MRWLGRFHAPGDKGSLSAGLIDSALARVRRPLDRAFERSATALEQMNALTAALDAGGAPATADGAPAASRGAGRRVLVASLRGWSTHNAYELVIAQALRVRGAEVALLTCGGGMPACELGWARRAHPRPCDRCAWLTERVAAAAGLRHYRLGELLPWGTDARAAPIDSGGDARADSRVSVAWLLRATQHERVPHAREIATDLAVAAEGVAHAASAVFADFQPEVVFVLNGLFGAEQTIRRLALGEGRRVPTYEMAPRAGARVLSQDSAAPDYDVDRLWERVRDRPLTAGQRAEVVSLLEDRARGVGAHESYHDRVEERPAALRHQLGLNGRERLVSLFTNVTWDSAAIGHDIGFASMFDWVEHAVRMADGARDLALVVRIHPAESRWGTREGVQEVIVSRLGAIPANVRFIAAGDPLSSYALVDMSDLVLTYTTTVGLEAAARGRRVAVAGDTHYRGRGFTADVADAEDLERALVGEADRPHAGSAELAIRYAHMFFFRAMIPFPAVLAEDGRVRRLPRAAELAPGADPYLDWVCDRILDGRDFGLPDELARARPGEPQAV
jgi:hypothetical protein